MQKPAVAPWGGVNHRDTLSPGRLWSWSSPAGRRKPRFGCWKPGLWSWPATHQQWDPGKGFQLHKIHRRAFVGLWGSLWKGGRCLCHLDSPRADTVAALFKPFCDSGLVTCFLNVSLHICSAEMMRFCLSGSGKKQTPRQDSVGKDISRG